MRERTWVFYFCILSLFSLLLVQRAQAAYCPLPPRFSANAYASDFAVGQADLLIPVNSNYCTHNLYLDPDISYGSDNQGYADLGLGYRWVQNGAAILGAYLFGGYNRIANNARLWVANPGIEALGSRWDAHLNGYFVMKDRSYTVAEGFGHQFGFDTIHFTGHNAYDALFKITQYAGPGLDAQVAYQLFPNSSWKGYLGSYFFAPGHSAGHVWGGAAGLEYWLHQNIKVFGNYTYDNVNHNTAALGLGVEFGGVRVHRSDPYLQERLTDPVVRYLAELGHGSIPSRKVTQLVNPSELLTRSEAGLPAFPGEPDILLDNIAFFSQSGTPNGSRPVTINDCTMESPCGPLDVTQVNFAFFADALPETTFLFNGGTYPATVSATSSSNLALQQGQSVYGRTPDYQNPGAVGANLFAGGFNMTGFNNFDSGTIFPPTASSASTVGVSATNAPDVLISNAQIGATVGGVNYYPNSGVRAVNAELDIDNTVINAGFVNAVFPSAVTAETSTVNIINSQLNVSVTSTNPLVGLGIPGSTLDMLNSNITVTNSGIAGAFGISGGSGTYTNGVINVTGGIESAITVNQSEVVITATCVLNGTAVPCQ
jgi:hypothetical protein